MSPFVIYTCSCIEGPYPAKICWQHGQPVKDNPFRGAQNVPGTEEEKRGVARMVDCIHGRPITVWITNERCDGARLCPGRYDCKYKPAQKRLL